MMPKQKSKIKFEISKVYTTDLTDIHHIAVCSDGSMWMADNARLKLQHVKLMENRTVVITSLNTKIYEMAKTPSNTILVTTDETKLKLINTVTGEMTDSRYDVKPLYPRAIHLSRDHRVIVGARSPGEPFPATGIRVVIVMDQEGKELHKYEHDKHNKRVFTVPRFITSTSHGNICVVDWLDNYHRGRVVALAPGGDILGIYSGHPEVNTDNNPFKPRGILTTPSDIIVVIDLDNPSLHILTDQGQIMNYYNFGDMGIIFPYSLALSTTGTIYIGCVSVAGSSDTRKAKLYELNYSGF
ncbi:uncharacterized protein LOC143056187 [Mytilus galloprovincialis]|uniref:uncharacterized protein LOC143056187 n=1 Tax=Mytilus galloprovincialis TaxID=29158 RepID=UPI003F7B5A50